jgi:O-antigen ligase
MDRQRLALVTFGGALLLALSPLPGGLKLLVLLVALVPLGVAVGLRLEPGLLLALALAGSMFSGFSGYIGLPTSPDRLLFALALGAMLCGAPLGGPPRPRLRWRSVHTWMLITVGIVVVLGWAAGSFDIDIGRFALLDRLGIVPFIAFAMGPIVFASARQRSYLTATLVAVGWYLGLTALLEGFGMKELAWPRYINDPFVGLHFERARGPFAESTAMGIALLGCLVGCVLALKTWQSKLARASAWLLIPVLLLGVVFTLTRAVWLAAVASALVAVVLDQRARRFLLPIGVAGVVAVSAALVFIPGLDESVSERRQEQRAVWDRLNTNLAAFDAIEDQPLTGVGWALFAKKSETYLEQQPEYPLTGRKIEVHNIVLSRLVEIGFLGTIPWLMAHILGIVVPAWRRASPELEPWRLGLIMFATTFAVMGMFGPLTAAFPNLLLWLFAGIVAAPYTTWPAGRAPQDDQRLAGVGT